jgi:hypothetical protein
VDPPEPKDILRYPYHAGSPGRLAVSKVLIPDTDLPLLRSVVRLRNLSLQADSPVGRGGGGHGPIYRVVGEVLSSIDAVDKLKKGEPVQSPDRMLTVWVASGLGRGRYARGGPRNEAA